MSQTPANWYPDPGDPASIRYWDGTAWTGFTRPVAGAPSAGAPTVAGDASARRQSHRGLWIALGAVGVLIVGLGIAGALFLAGKFAPISPDYTGAPVTSSDVAPPGRVTVISSDETVAAEIPTGWRDLQDYEDLEAVAGDLPTGASMLGAWFTHAPETAKTMPQLAVVLEMTPEAAGPGTLDDIRSQVLDGMRSAVPSFEVGPSQEYMTALGLEGSRTDATFEMTQEGFSCKVAVIAVAHGRRFVVVQWTSYDGPVDEESLDAFMSALRVDS